jgi:hypothetical protein
MGRIVHNDAITKFIICSKSDAMVKGLDFNVKVEGFKCAQFTYLA